MNQCDCSVGGPHHETCRVFGKFGMLSQEEIKDAYMNMREMYHQLVGRMFPSVVYRDLMELAEAYVGVLPAVRPPNRSGYVD